ncbi:MAG: AMP-binding protein [Methylacidiphilales bacterium]|nr:AMP-binding protein [Candidatus Methylacidiphilales bacterium]
MKLKVVLAIDGGGIRGIISCRILLRLIDEIRKVTRKQDAHLADFVDYFAGTSTGSILVSAMITPSVYSPSKPAYTIGDIQSFYIENAKKIFSKSLSHSITSLGGITKSKYENKGLHDVLYSYFGGLQLSQLMKPCTLTSFDLFTNKNLYFRSQDARNNSSHDFYVRDACLASSSAPMYFPPANIRNVNGERFLCCDGVVFANNPSLCAYADYRKIEPNAFANNMIFISVGNGVHDSTYDLTSFERTGGAGSWFKAFSDVFIGSVSESIDFQLRMIYRECPNLYFRWVPYLGEGISRSIDTTSIDDLSIFIDVADAFVDSNAEQIKKIANLLYNNSIKDDISKETISTTEISTTNMINNSIPPLPPTWTSRYTDNARYPISYDNYDNVVEMINQTTRIHRDKIAFESFNQTISFEQVGFYSDHIAGWLQKHAMLKPNSRVAVFLPNILAFPPLLFGIIKAGCIPVCCNPTYTSRELIHVLKNSDVSLLFTFDRNAKVVEEAIKDNPVPVVCVELVDLFPLLAKLIVRIALRLKLGKADPWTIPTLTLNDITKFSDCSIPRPVTINNNNTLLHQYTGGTTGIIKAAELTHKNIIANMLQITSMMPREFIRPDIQQIACTPLPLYHIFSLTVNLFTCFSLGTHNVLITNPRDLTTTIKTMSKYRYNFLTGVSPLFYSIANHSLVKNLDFSDLRICIAGGMSVPESVAKLWKEKTNNTIIQGYGLTEASPVVSCCPHDIKSFDGSIGIPLPDTEIAIVNEEGVTVKTGQSGELLVRGPQVMKGYLEQKEETKLVITEEGWLKTGDLAYIDDRGFLFIVDRLKNLINVSGFKVFPNEIENVLLTHPSLLEAACIGIASDKTGQKVVAVVVAKNPSITDKEKQIIIDELKTICNNSLTHYKTPREYYFIPALPKSTVGKALHRILVEQYDNLKNN